MSVWRTPLSPIGFMPGLVPADMEYTTPHSLKKGRETQ